MKPESVAYRMLCTFWNFPEANDLCLGYTANGTRGSGEDENTRRVSVSPDFVLGGITAATRRRFDADCGRGIS